MPADKENFRSSGYRHIDWIADYFDRVRDLPVLPDTAPGDLTALLPASAPEQGECLEQIFADFQSTVFPALTLWNHPRFFGYFANSSPPACVLGDLLASAVNVNVMLWKSSPAGTELEQVALGWIRQWLGLSNDWFGIIYDTASISTMQSIAAAREWKEPACRIEGMRPGLMLYISEHTHSSAEKAAIALGFGQRNIRKIPVDAEFRMRPDLLKEAIEADLALGKRPCCIVASIGSTSTSAIDPVPAIAAIAEQFNLWLHVDAAYGGAAAIVPEMQHILAGVERAHSFVVNPHKWLFVASDCSILYTRRPDMLRQSVQVTPEYLRTAQDGAAVNFMEYGVQLGRRFRALKLWYMLRNFGRQGFVSILREHLRAAQALKGWVESSDDFELCAPVPLGLVCFRHKAGDEFNRQLLDSINQSGKAFLSHTVLNGNYVLRFSIGNFQTTEADVRQTWDLICTLAKSQCSTPA